MIFFYIKIIQYTTLLGISLYYGYKHAGKRINKDLNNIDNTDNANNDVESTTNNLDSEEYFYFNDHELENLPKEIKDKLECPISLCIFREPVITKHGYTFEKKALLNWLKTNQVCPFTKQNLNIRTDIRRNDNIKLSIKYFVLKNRLGL